jgi:hypothetical protein
MATLAEARAALERIRPRLDDIIAIRAALAEMRADLTATGGSALGGLADAKGHEARIFAELESIASEGIQVKGYAPLLLDWPGTLDDVPVLWCWLEGDATLEWYHRADTGFAGRRRVPA